MAGKGHSRGEVLAETWIVRRSSLREEQRHRITWGERQTTCFGKKSPGYGEEKKVGLGSGMEMCTKRSRAIPNRNLQGKRQKKHRSYEEREREREKV